MKPILAFNNRKPKSCESDETSLEKLVKSHQDILFLAGFAIWNYCLVQTSGANFEGGNPI